MWLPIHLFSLTVINIRSSIFLLPPLTYGHSTNYTNLGTVQNYITSFSHSVLFLPVLFMSPFVDLRFIVTICSVQHNTFSKSFPFCHWLSWPVTIAVTTPSSNSSVGSHLVIPKPASLLSCQLFVVTFIVGSASFDLSLNIHRNWHSTVSYLKLQ
jgi:hypothetical protein